MPLPSLRQVRKGGPYARIVSITSPDLSKGDKVLLKKLIINPQTETASFGNTILKDITCITAKGVIQIYILKSDELEVGDYVWVEKVA